MSLAWKVALILRRFAGWQIDVVLFLKASSLNGVGVKAKPGFVVLDASPLKELARQLHLLLAAGKDVAIDDLVKFAV